MTSPITIRKVESSRDRREFLQLPWTIYKGNPYWVPPLLTTHLGLIGFKKDAYYLRNRIQTFLARRGSEVVGRIAAIYNQGHLDLHQDNRGFFGFFECKDDPEAACALFDAAREWLAEQGLKNIRGPMNPSMNHEVGLLVDGFDHTPTFMMTYNPPYYEKLIEGYGFQKSQDMYAFVGFIEMLPKILARFSGFVQQIRERFGVQIRPLDRKRFDEDVRGFLDVYNRSLCNTWGYVPMSAEELEQEARGLKQLLAPELAIAAEIDGKLVGCLICLHDFNPRIRDIKGKLFPFGFLHLLMHKNRITKIRSISTNVLPEYQLMGIPLLMLNALVPVADSWGIQKAEFSWVLESNSYSRGSLEKAGMIREKTYRVYDLDE
ncbi:MAG: GNAT family N-acetyltransferase [Planctomycetia bacterium]|nr:GNAT family N-acetyltransferase [Planctomycetia bacterium]